MPGDCLRRQSPGTPFFFAFRLPWVQLLSHCHQVSRELCGIEGTPAGCHIVAGGDGIGAAVETDLVVV